MTTSNVVEFKRTQKKNSDVLIGEFFEYIEKRLKESNIFKDMLYRFDSDIKLDYENKKRLTELYVIVTINRKETRLNFLTVVDLFPGSEIKTVDFSIGYMENNLIYAALHYNAGFLSVLKEVSTILDCPNGVDNILFDGNLFNCISPDFNFFCTALLAAKRDLGLLDIDPKKRIYQLTNECWEGIRIQDELKMMADGEMKTPDCPVYVVSSIQGLGFKSVHATEPQKILYNSGDKYLRFELLGRLIKEKMATLGEVSYDVIKNYITAESGFDLATFRFAKTVGPIAFVLYPMVGLGLSAVVISVSIGDKK